MSNNDDNNKVFHYEKRSIATLKERAGKHKINDQMRLALIFTAISLLIILPAGIYIGIVIERKLGEKSPSQSVVYVQKEGSGTSDDSCTSQIYLGVSQNTVKITAATRMVFNDGTQAAVSQNCNGIVWSMGNDKMYILSCLSLVRGARELVATLPDGSTLPLTLKCGDNESDVALLSCDVSPAVNSVTIYPMDDDLDIGENVLMVGYSCITQGIIEKYDSDDSYISEGMNFIYTNATLDDNCMGCGLYTSGGALIGLVTHSIFRNQSQNSTLVLPLNELQPIAEDLIVYGYVKGRIDVDFVIMDAHKNGSLVVAKVEDKDCNLQEGDVIKGIDTTIIQNTYDWGKTLLSHSIGDTITITVERGKETLEVEYEIKEKTK